MIREATKKDLNAIESVCLDAFEPNEREIVANVAVDLFADESAQPVLVLVAESESVIVGTVLFSHLWIEYHPEVRCSILAPLAVRKSHQRTGLGGKLIAHGLEQLKNQGVEHVFVLGDPRYYTRHGFHAGHGFKPPYELAYPEAWLVQTIDNATTTVNTGQIRCSRTLDVQDLW